VKPKNIAAALTYGALPFLFAVAPALADTLASSHAAMVERGSAFGSDMSVVHEMLADHNKIRRTVTNLPNGIRTVTESDDPTVAKEIKDHVASMDQRLKDGKVFNVASRTLPTIFANNAKIHTEIQQTAKRRDPHANLERSNYRRRLAGARG
jgi:hypothetical protein